MFREMTPDTDEITLVEQARMLAKKVLDLEYENKKLKETIKDHQLYEEKLEHRIIELEELLHWE